MRLEFRVQGFSTRAMRNKASSTSSYAYNRRAPKSGRDREAEAQLGAPGDNAVWRLLTVGATTMNLCKAMDANVCCGLGFGVWGLGFGIWGLGFRVRLYFGRQKPVWCKHCLGNQSFLRLLTTKHSFRYSISQAHPKP